MLVILIISQFICLALPTKFSLLISVLHGLCLLSSYYFSGLIFFNKDFQLLSHRIPTLYTSCIHKQSVLLDQPVTMQETAPPLLGSLCQAHLRGCWFSCIFESNTYLALEQQQKPKQYQEHCLLSLDLISGTQITGNLLRNKDSEKLNTERARTQSQLWLSLKPLPLTTKI